jgi:NhaP-type Na+/H+ or K+/H+ antiporter
MQVVLWFAGLRGAMSFALVEHVPLYDAVSGEGTPLKPELKAMTSASILFTVFILGGYTYYMMEQLGLAPPMSSTRRGVNANSNGGSHPAFEMASLISKADSGDDESLYEPSARKGQSSVATSSGRNLAFRRQRQASHTDAPSPKNNED